MMPGARRAKNAATSARARTSRFSSPVSGSTQCTWSGSSSALLCCRPLRTGHASRPASGSSHSSALRCCSTELLHGTLRGSTMDKIRFPLSNKRIGLCPDFDVPLDRDRHRAEELNRVATQSLRHRKYPRTASVCVEVSLTNPACSFRRVPTPRPLQSICQICASTDEKQAFAVTWRWYVAQPRMSGLSL